MNSTTMGPKPGLWNTVLGAGILLAATLASAVAGRTLGSTTREGALGIAAGIAVGTLAMAWWSSRRTRYPRWSVYAAGGVLAAITLASAAWTPDLAAWSESAKSMGWMLPWTLLLFGLTPARSGDGVCAPNHPRAGWILIGVSTLVGVLLWLAGWIAART